MSKEKLERGYISPIIGNRSDVILTNSSCDITTPIIDKGDRYIAKWNELKRWIAEYNDCHKMPEDRVRTLLCIYFLSRFT